MERKDEIIEALKKGTPRSEIMEKFNISKGRVSQIASEAGITPQKSTEPKKPRQTHLNLNQDQINDRILKENQILTQQNDELQLKVKALEQSLDNCYHWDEQDIEELEHIRDTLMKCYRRRMTKKDPLEKALFLTNEYLFWAHQAIDDQK